ncbi:TOMM precursor leader peptide-binding protein [Streptomyces sp. H10-C2]|uniref:TOMM precursor leader peptide-binding protein n=1 Tax=unclassified Streptomyces TaxID=2593676 RepID=UPI0024BB847C|nr:MULTISPECIES: TOMM precursor leader peptide-binding protein [unclassified Streptomyces]MDJ0343211.1 TOMM precursor leader peptide-binding protein [Streptomyces sp. PH10-H1]MDJ0370656.1 TOMM precursor leader peptide-binding protein [Streptomyces sp. H10-C2]
MLKTAMRRSWRNRESVQFGIDPAHAVVLDPVDGAAAGFLDLLDGTRGAALLTRDAEALGLGAQQVRQLLGLLAEGGVLDDAAAHAGLSEAVRHRTAAIDRLRPDLAALSVVHSGPGGAATRIRDRRSVRVRVCGAGRVGAAVASLLSAAGVGRVEVLDSGRVEPWDVSPGGIPAEHIGERRDAAARGAVRRAAPDPRAAALGRRGPRHGRAHGDGHGDGHGHERGPAESRLGLVVLAPRDGLAAYAPDPRESARLLAAGIPHLYTGVVEGMGVVGPLVTPGRTACAGCLALRLADEDPAWPRMLAQLRSGRAPAVPACDIALATTVAGLAAGHALSFLDGGIPPSSGARVELALARLSMEVRPVPGDIRCGCGAGRDRGTELPSAPRVGRGTMAG